MKRSSRRRVRVKPPPRSIQRARRQASQKNVTQQQQQTQTQTQTQVPVVEEEKEKGNGNIKWDGNRGMLLVYKLRDEYKRKWLCGTRIRARYLSILGFVVEYWVLSINSCTCK